MGRDEVLGKRVVDVFPFLRDAGNEPCFTTVLEGEETVSENHPYGPSETGVFESHYSPLRDENNEIVGGIAVITDITTRKQAEEATHAAYKQLAFHVESSPLAVVEWDSDFRVSRWSASAERLFGWKADEVIGKHVNEWRFVFTDDVDAVALVTNRQREGVEVQGVLRNRNYTRDGKILFCEWYNSVLRDDAVDDRLHAPLALLGGGVEQQRGVVEPAIQTVSAQQQLLARREWSFTDFHVGPITRNVMNRDSPITTPADADF